MEIRFKIGDKVVALTNPKSEKCQPRIKGEVYVVNDIKYCSVCGVQCINIGHFQMSSSGRLLCGCGHADDNRGLAWTGSMFFAKVDECEDALELAIENEDYELASILRDL